MHFYKKAMVDIGNTKGKRKATVVFEILSRKLFYI